MATDLSPTARALRALEVLRHRPGTTAEELGERLGVSERAARRYVGILREAGVDVGVHPGAVRRVPAGQGTRLPPVVFTKAEALSLVMAVLDASPAPAEGEDLVGSALDKVVRALPERVGQEAAALREHASSARDGRWTSPDPALTSALVDAVATRRSAVVAYRSESGNEWEAEVDPWAVVVRHGRWYLLCRSHRADAIRTYRIDRVRAVQPTDSSFAPPDGPRRGGRAGGEPRHRMGVPHPRAVPRAVRGWRRGSGRRWDGSSPPGDGCVLVGSTSNPAMYASEWLANVPYDFEVEDGPELRAAGGPARRTVRRRGAPAG